MKVRKIFLETGVREILLCGDGMFSNTIFYINEESKKKYLVNWMISLTRFPARVVEGPLVFILLLISKM